MRYWAGRGLTGSYTARIKLCVKESKAAKKTGAAQPPSALLRHEMKSRDLNCQSYCSIPLLNRLLLHFCVYCKTPKSLLNEVDSYIRITDFYSILLCSIVFYSIPSPQSLLINEVASQVMLIDVSSFASFLFSPKFNYTHPMPSITGMKLAVGLN